MKTVCIMCPMGCELTVTKKDNNIVVTGNSCARGLTYGKNEITNPLRMVTALIKTENGVLPVKTTDVVPKDKINLVLSEIKKVNLKKAKAGDVVIKNVCNLKIDVVVTGNYN